MQARINVCGTPQRFAAERRSKMIEECRVFGWYW